MIDFGYGVVLRRLHQDDLKAAFRWRNDPRVWYWCRQNSPLHWDDHLAWYDKQADDKKLSMFAVIQDGNLIGVTGLTDIDLINSRAEFSLYIDPEKQSKGYGLAALKTLFLHGFQDMGLNRIWGETFDGNPAIFMFVRKLGMELEGSRKEFYYRDGSFIDAHLVSVSADKFRNLFNFKRVRPAKTSRPLKAFTSVKTQSKPKARLQVITDRNGR